MPHDDKQLDSLPPEIIERLRGLDGPAVLPDPQRDADVLDGARRHLAATAQVQRKRRNLRLFFAGGAGGAIAAAAMIAVVVFIGGPTHQPQTNQDLAAATKNTTQPGDLDADGEINILDAYALAKQVQTSNTSDEHDFNRDGRVDQSDIDWLASQAVALHTGERG